MPAYTPHVEDEDAKREEASLVQALREHDEAAFTLLLNRYHKSLLALAMYYVSGRAIAEEVVQETWLASFEVLIVLRAVPHSKLGFIVFS